MALRDRGFKLQLIFACKLILRRGNLESLGKFRHYSALNLACQKTVQN